MLSSNTLFSNRHKVPAWRVPSEASNTPKMGATAGVALPLLAAHRLEGSRLLAHPVNHGWAGIQGRDDAAITPTLGPGRRQAWACAQSVGVGLPDRGGDPSGSNLGSPVRVGGSTRLLYCNQGHAASGSGFGCPSRAGPGGSPGTKSSRPRSVVCVLGLALTAASAATERDHHVDLMRLFSLVMRQPRELSTATARLMAS